MATLNTSFSRLNAAQTIALADLVIPKLAPAAPTPPPVPNLAAKVTLLTTARNNAKTANDVYESARTALGSLRSARNAKLDLLRVEHKVVISAIEAEAREDAVMLGATGYPLASTTAVSSVLPSQVHNLALTAGDLDGSVDVSFDPEVNSKTYEVQVSLVDPLSGPWTTLQHPTISSTTLSGLTSGQRIWVRVRGIGTKGAGAWSDPATKIVP